MIELDLPKQHELPAGTSDGCVIAVDAGATKTRAMAYDLSDGTTVEAVSGSGNQDSVGADRAIENITQAITESVASRPVRGVLLAAAANDPVAVRAAITDRFSGSGYVEVVNDVIGAWGSSFGGEDGITLISGTGSHAVGVIDGRAIRVGGWGHIFGDEGSAWGLGHAAVSACLYARDGRGPATQLTQLIEETAGGKDISELVPELYASENLKAETAAYAQLVDRAAIDGDAVAVQIITTAGAQLALHISTLARELPASEGVSVGLVGSTWKSAKLLEAFHGALNAEGGVVATIKAERVEREPVEGVLALLLRALGRESALPGLGW
jgi:N-acetylglucosamine kinase-like BadF-type ATPase